MVNIATFNEVAKAKRLRDRLQESGVKADVNSEGQLQQAASLAGKQAHVKVSVGDEDFAKAQQLLVDWETSDPELASSAIRCPQCNSSRLQYPQLTRKFLMPAITGVLLALKMFPKEFYCEDCQYTWNNEGEQPRGRLWNTFFPGRDPVEKD